MGLQHGTAERARNFTIAREDGLDGIELPSIGGEWSRGERGVLRVLLDPTYFAASVPEKARAAGISKRRFQQIIQRRDFQPIIRACYRTALRTRIAPIINASIETASKPGRDGSQDRAMLLQMAGFYEPRRHIDVTPSPQPSICGIVGISMEQWEQLETTTEPPE